MTKKMNWKNLKQSKCPECGQQLILKTHEDSDKKYFACEKCSYYINEPRYKEIVKNMLRQENCFIRY